MRLHDLNCFFFMSSRMQYVVRLVNDNPECFRVSSKNDMSLPEIIKATPLHYKWDVFISSVTKNNMATVAIQDGGQQSTNLWVTPRWQRRDPHIESLFWKHSRCLKLHVTFQVQHFATHGPNTKTKQTHISPDSILFNKKIIPFGK